MKSKEILNLYPGAPLSPQLLNFIDRHVDFEKALKLSAFPRFIFIPRIICSYPPNFDDEIIGTFYFDTEKKIFKQDYIVNCDLKHEQFISCSRMSKDIVENERMKGIDTFFRKYGEWDEQKKAGKFYCREHGEKSWMHHYGSIDELPDDRDIRTLAQMAFMNWKAFLKSLKAS